MNDLLKSAIADAKAIKDTAMQNAKATLEESIFYKVSPLLESKEEEEEKDNKMDEGNGEQPPWLQKKKKPNMEAKEEGEEDEEEVEEAYGKEDDGEEKDDQNESASLEEILAELEEELKSSNIGTGDNKVDNYDSDTEDPQGPKYFSRKDVMGALESMFEAAIGDKEEDEEEDDEKKDMKQMQNELKEAYEVVNQLKGMLQEVNLLNSKLLYTSKLFRNYALSENQKKDILENFERVVTIREAKLLYSTYAKVHEGVDTNKGKKSKSLTESFASKPTNSTAPSAATKSNIVNESNNLRARLQELAGIIK
tara:strand:+ start:7178 stop:8104 length:927 start_codon:yes stop_codon:yes gene_type:complete